MTTTAATSASDIPDNAARKALIASAVGYAMDGFDLLILGFMLRAISADLGLTPPQLGSLNTMTLVGAVGGGIGSASSRTRGVSSQFRLADTPPHPPRFARRPLPARRGEVRSPPPQSRRRMC